MFTPTGEDKSIKLIALEMNEFYIEMAETLKSLRMERQRECNEDDDDASRISVETETKLMFDSQIYEQYMKVKDLNEKIFQCNALLKVVLLSI